MYGPRTVGVVLPAYNEEAGISAAVKDFLAQDSVDKVYVIDNNSTDRTAELAQEAGAILISEPNQGYGWALRRGLKEADTDYVALCEPDGTFLVSGTITNQRTRAVHTIQITFNLVRKEDGRDKTVAKVRTTVAGPIAPNASQKFSLQLANAPAFEQYMYEVNFKE